MKFENDPRSQFLQIRHNIFECAHTSNSDRNLFLKEIDRALNGKGATDVSLSDIELIQKEIRRIVMEHDLYFRGPNESAAGQLSSLSTRSEDRFILSCAMSYRSHAVGLSPADAIEMAKDLMFQLLDNLTFPIVRDQNRSLSLQKIKVPMWLADPKSGIPITMTNIGHLPARLGLKPEIARYILLTVVVDNYFSPMFADSGAYPYWRPGGKTLPIDGCPTELDGLAEYITGGAVVGDISAPIRSYNRVL